MSQTASLASRREDSKVVFMTETAVLIAITLIMGLTPLGTLRTPLLSVSIVTIPVAIAAMLIGPAGAVACAAVFGLTSLYNAVTGTSGLLSTLLQVSPFGVFVTAVVARVLDGLATGYLFKGIKKVAPKPVACYLTGLAAPVLNTVFFMGSLMLFFYKSDFMMEKAAALGAHNPMSLIVAMVGVQGVIEAIAGCLLGGTVGYLVSKALHR